jgi:excisionase family DNA binding protein
MASMTINEVLDRVRISRQAIYFAIHSKKLKAMKIGGRLYIDEGDLIEYRNNLYSRDKSMFKGDLLYDVSQGTYSLKRAAEYLGIKYGQLYHFARKKKIKHERKRTAWIFKKEDLDNLKIIEGELL